MQSKRAIVVADLGFGDAGKGSIVDFLARKGGVSAVVRYSGAGQAAHNVVTPDGRHHTFRQFGSGTFVPGVRTHLSRFMLIDPIEMVAEANHLQAIGCSRVFDRLSVDEDAVVITPFHKNANFIREYNRGDDVHGTCGMGVGETKATSLAYPGITIYAKDLKDRNILFRKLVRVREYFDAEFADNPLYRDVAKLKEKKGFAALFQDTCTEQLADLFAEIGGHIIVVRREHLRLLEQMGSLIFEGAQGVLLDEWYGFHPHTTWSTTTFQNALTLLDEIGYDGAVERLGVLRAYHTRHGAGPFVTEDRLLTQLLPDHHNGDDGWQGTFRCGWLDLVMAKYALSVCGGADSLAITNLDRFIPIADRKVCSGYSFEEGSVSLEERTMLTDVARSEQCSSLFVGGIKKKQAPTDLVYQEVLTGLLKKAVPQYVRMTGNAEEYIAGIEDNLEVPVSIASYGSTATDKRLR